MPPLEVTIASVQSISSAVRAIEPPIPFKEAEVNEPKISISPLVLVSLIFPAVPLPLE